ncbi:hypothetical protein JCM30760_20850 [Thiomicrorhabdus hydrogeniphila]
MQSASTMKSKPFYPPININDSIQNHLFIAESGAFSELSETIDQCKNGEKSYWVVGDTISENLEDKVSVVPISQFKETFSDLFAKLPFSSNIYIAAQTEAFLWDVHNLAVKAGLAEEQIQKIKPLTNQRRLFCTHCYTITDGVTQTPFECPGCHRLLLVRDHFSTIHAAYVGVQINAEDPNETHPIEELN